jgi:ADP-heptose:LPS heptosyltransferase
MGVRTPEGRRIAEPPEHIAVVRATQLGDLLCAVPLVRALRRHWPQARISLVGLPWARAIVERYPAYLDDLLEFPGWAGIPERAPDPGRLADFRHAATAARFDLALQAHGSGRSMNGFMPQLQARQTAGFHPAGDRSPSPGFIPYPDDRHEILRLLELATHVGARELSPALEFPVWPPDRQEAERLREELGLGSQPYACLHPGSSTATRRWRADGFARIADALVDDGLRVVLTGTAQEIPIADEVRLAARHALLSAVGMTSLGGLAALVAEARLLVTNDTGVSHLAAALDVPSVVIFTGSEPGRWAPLAAGRHVAVVEPSVATAMGALRQQVAQMAGAAA